jgi:heptosyltransferase-3
MKSSLSSNNNVLVYRLGSLGDTLVVLPAFHLVRRTYPHAKITLLTNAPVSQKAAPARAVLEGSGLVDDYLSYPVGLREPRMLLSLIGQIRAKKCSDAVYLAKPKGGMLNVMRDILLLQAGGIRRVHGVPISRGYRYCRAIPGHRAVESEGCRVMRCLRKLGNIDIANPESWSLGLSDRESEVANAFVGNSSTALWLGVSIGAKASAKDWEDPNWSILLHMIQRTWPTSELYFVGSEDEYARSQRLIDMSGLRGANLCGQLTPRVSAGVLSRMNVFIGHDSGPMHLAAAVGTPVIAIFSSRNIPGEWYPCDLYGRNRIVYHEVPCMGCQLVDCISERKRCILSITPDEVFQALQEVVSTNI